MQHWIVTSLDVQRGDLPALAKVRAGLLTVAGCPVVVLARRPTPLSRPRVWVAAVPEVAR